ncbi:hypothetical protein BDB01DRAFT_781522 [Pilobolus umbonatus]|nr:hypothetical protein BDB01DRAFT_781522 [Pilobolus umbonatus]
MASIPKDQKVSSLFSDLRKSIDNYDDEHSLEICEELIKINPTDRIALHCKVVSLIRLEKYKDALTIIARQFKNSDIDLSPEKIYCYYRTNQLSQAIELLDELKTKKQDDPALMFLQAQLLYSQGKFDEAIKVYETLLKTTDTKSRLYDEIQVNLLAVKAGLLFSQKKADCDMVEQSADLYEVAYNAASVYIACGDLTNAQKKLVLAKKQCNDKSVGISQEELDEDLAIINTQLAYTYQLQGRVEEAKKIYQSVLDSNDVSVVAVASNNLVAVDQTKDLEDAVAKMKIATSKEADQRLKTYQKRIIYMNECLLELYTKKYSACRDRAQKLVDKYPDNDELYLILASATYYQSKAAKAIEELKMLANKRPQSVAIRFATIQLQLLESQPVQALDTLLNYMETVKSDKSAYYRPAIIALLIWLYEKSGQSDKAMSILDEASTVWKSDPSFKSTTTPLSVVKQTAAFKLKSGRYEEAAVDYEQLVKNDPSDTQSIAGLIAAYAEIDPSKAEQYGNALPAITLSTIDIKELENNVPGVKKGYVKKDPNSNTVNKTKSKKKRSPLLPKHYDPNVQPDPERWIPKHERANYRKKRK